jgi:hypothetical protein
MQICCSETIEIIRLYLCKGDRTKCFAADGEALEAQLEIFLIIFKEIFIQTLAYLDEQQFKIVPTA